MGAGPVAAGPAPSPGGSWKLAAAVAADTQGLVASAFGHLPCAEALFLCLSPTCSGDWLAKLRAAVPISDASGAVDPSAAIAFTFTGLKVMGLDDAALESFSTPFQEGMHQVDRQRRLSDRPDLGAVIDGGPAWSGNTPDPVAALSGEAVTVTPATVHAVLLLYGADDAPLDAEIAKAVAVLESNGVDVCRRLRLSLRLDADGRAREHFGFADGMSQPVPWGDAVIAPKGAPPRDPWHAIAIGDVLMGHANAHDEPAPGPVVQAKGARGDAGVLPAGRAPPGFCDLGLNGSYLVMRELRQDVPAFWTSMDAAAAKLGAPAISAEALAAKVVGRTLDGDPLAPGGVIPPVGEDPANAFGFLKTDPHGMGCPLGSHIRRANPRDGLAPTAAAGPDLLTAANNHRILRRGRKFGPGIADPRTPDGQDRGLLFMCLNTDLVRQFEFVQQTWLLNQAFATLFNEIDPLMGKAGPFTIPTDPLRRKALLETYIRFAGGEYFFLPSLPALDYLATLPGAAKP